MIILFIVSLDALAAGYRFISDPTGSGLGIDINYLKKTGPFNNYFIPGLILFVTIGIMSSIIALLAIFKKFNYPLLFLLQGCILVGWIAVQIFLVTSFHPLQLVISIMGFILITIGFVMLKRTDFKSNR